MIKNWALLSATELYKTLNRSLNAWTLTSIIGICLWIIITFINNAKTISKLL